MSRALTMRLPVLLVTAGHGPTRADGRAASTRALDLLAAALGERAGSTSVSHTREISVAAAVIGSPARIGVDLEADRAADPRTGRFFLRDHELAWLDTVHTMDTAASRQAEHLRLWTVKEALFKSDPGNADSVMLSYALADPAARAGYARREPGGALFGYGSARLGGRHLSIAACLAGLRAGIPMEGSTMNTGTTENTGITDSTGTTANTGTVEDPGTRGSAGTPDPEITTEAVLDRIAELLVVPASELAPQTPIRELVRESFMLVELVIDLQEEFGTYFSQEDLREIGTIGELVALLQASPRS
jgi:acyl carrier protein